ncbi:HAMP domain-containing protein [Herbaspirillum seropedicae]|uniref:methyl-accepting chemotaxis protein n=1 Tax=Herbaspirillum seropedicae TaxID=964 RepID=UPI001123B1E3|nr:methyl-accepting chemotaxis protein [Herbaspirillum seropedicae]QDD66313.1 HAMP domain-containing protein [Herbaspirillum seropedicae]
MKLSIVNRLYILIGAVIIGCVVLTGANMVKMNRTYKDASFASENVVPSLLSLAAITQGINGMRIATWRYLALTDSVDRGTIESSFNSAKKRVEDALKKYEQEQLADETDKELLQAVRASYQEFDKSLAEALKLANAGQWNEARALLGNNQPMVDRLNKALAEQRAYNEKISEAGAHRAQETMAAAQLHAILISAAVIAVVTIIGLLIARKIARSLAEAVELAETIAEGDLTREIDTSSTDEIGHLMAAMAKMNRNLVTIVATVRTGVSTVAAASSQIATGNMDLSARTEQQASSLEQTAAATEELTSTVKQNAENALQADQLASAASGIAAEGGEVVKQVVTTMEEIRSSSLNIADIISVIDGIAFQTNILALNAAVEAARAGEQGRGFAVVATEVRSLAQRSASAAKEIKQLIDDSVSKVENGSQLVMSAGNTMQQVVESVRRVTDVVTEISAASREQSLGIEQVNQAISHMDQSTQENAALVEEATAAAQSLQEQARQLERAVNVFKLRQEAGAILEMEDRHTTHALSSPTLPKLPAPG